MRMSDKRRNKQPGLQSNFLKKMHTKHLQSLHQFAFFNPFPQRNYFSKLGLFPLEFHIYTLGQFLESLSFCIRLGLTCIIGLPYDLLSLVRLKVFLLLRGAITSIHITILTKKILKYKSNSSGSKISNFFHHITTTINLICFTLHYTRISIM